MVAGSAAFLTPPAHAACELYSGPHTAALVELYTSEGCSSCPPADRQLSRLREALDANAVVVPLSLHVTYWNYIGWIDPFGQRVFDERHHRLPAKPVSTSTCRPSAARTPTSSRRMPATAVGATTMRQRQRTRPIAISPSRTPCAGSAPPRRASAMALAATHCA
jgi:hypothetical protein